ncbi:hypothetical protein RIF29_21097 [Crotalaria pallida]|uniref:Uncharacterized protein n=1 Tax=Crotalaria pallida TaxID=3830 RepID=A0AAN9F446_CROPI
MTVGSYSELIRKIIFRHCKQFPIEKNHSGIGNSVTAMDVNDSGMCSRVEQKQPENAGVAVEFSDCFGENSTTVVFLLHKPLSLGVAASVSSSAVIDRDGMNHALTVKKVVPCDWLEHRVCAVTEVNAVKVMVDFVGKPKKTITGENEDIEEECGN